MAECTGALVVKDQGKHLAFGSEMQTFPSIKTRASIPLPLSLPTQSQSRPSVSAGSACADSKILDREPVDTEGPTGLAILYKGREH